MQGRDRGRLNEISSDDLGRKRGSTVGGQSYRANGSFQRNGGRRKHTMIDHDSRKAAVFKIAEFCSENNGSVQLLADKLISLYQRMLQNEASLKKLYEQRAAEVLLPLSNK